jgi:hypothetical protein
MRLTAHPKFVWFSKPTTMLESFIVTLYVLHMVCNILFYDYKKKLYHISLFLVRETSVYGNSDKK